MNKWWIVSRDTIIFIWLSWAHCSSYNSQINSFRYRCSTESVQTFWSNVGLFRVTITDPKSENHAPTWISSTALLPPMFHYPHSQLPPLTFWGGGSRFSIVACPRKSSVISHNDLKMIKLNCFSKFCMNTKTWKPRYSFVRLDTAILQQQALTSWRQRV